MRRYMKNLTALLLALILLLSAYLPTFAAGQPSKYSSTSNSGQRGVVCTTLSGTSAASYYTGSYSYDSLDDLSGSTLLSSLRTLLTSTHKRTSSYDDCKNMASKTDCENNNGKVLLLYTSVSSTQGAANSGWNREHVWPKSLGGYETSGPGADLHHIRPSDNKVNSTRGNLRFGEVSGGKTATGGNAASGKVGGYYGSYFEPLDNVKGDVARICLYMYVRYGGSYSKCSSITNVFQSVDVLLEWCALDPVDTWEMGRNEVVEDFQGNRNVFIDYPELAWLLFNRSIPAGMTTPSGNASSGSQGGGNTSPDCTHASTTVKNATAPTCSKSGYTGDTYCTGCNIKLQSGSTIPATGNHTFGDWVINSEGTERSRRCDVCGVTELQEIQDGEPVGPSVSIPDDPMIPDSLIQGMTDGEIIVIYLTLGACEELFVGELSN